MTMSPTTENLSAASATLASNIKQSNFGMNGYNACSEYFIMLLILVNLTTKDSSPNDLKRYLQMERICFAVMFIQMALILVSSSLDPEKNVFRYEDAVQEKPKICG
ncbi:hypothetical protein RO3G_16833 [Rhizopus delemar RA 99-880]|uniref:Uncharacterized protein n=1 Tax=Rhizopus delemar (strain RA 99-880 / ATCC MYA-4621 / FGSC 9543 / NRRL 43880) TaxID=246409 RepID=I1CUJ2_RHIO9|nr:hypothetical protein RO3G_16833 [Rhizopus delemar RA 99-880]|eukprot:EIE92122.1 hypothetical protein RO3G_16833 [Rhizopus delemar RA 99-880]